MNHAATKYSGGVISACLIAVVPYIRDMTPPQAVRGGDPVRRELVGEQRLVRDDEPEHDSEGGQHEDRQHRRGTGPIEIRSSGAKGPRVPSPATRQARGLSSGPNFIGQARRVRLGPLTVSRETRRRLRRPSATPCMAQSRPIKGGGSAAPRWPRASAPRAGSSAVVIEVRDLSQDVSWFRSSGWTRSRSASRTRSPAE